MMRPTAAARDATGEPVDRGVLAAVLVERLAHESIGSVCHFAADADSRRPVLTGVEAQVVADLLDELAGVYPDEALGQLAGSLSARIWNRLD